MTALIHHVWAPGDVPLVDIAVYVGLPVVAASVFAWAKGWLEW